MKKKKEAHSRFGSTSFTILIENIFRGWRGLSCNLKALFLFFGLCHFVCFSSVLVCEWSRLELLIDTHSRDDKENSNRITIFATHSGASLFGCLSPHFSPHWCFSPRMPGQTSDGPPVTKWRRFLGENK